MKKSLNERRSVEAWLSLVERYIRDVEVAGSNPVASTVLGQAFCCLLYFFAEKSKSAVVGKKN